jgi:hypothetical protein
MDRRVSLTPRFTDCVKTPRIHFASSKKRSSDPSARIKMRHIEFVEVGFLAVDQAAEFSHSLFSGVRGADSGRQNRFSGFRRACKPLELFLVKYPAEAGC